MNKTTLKAYYFTCHFLNTIEFSDHTDHVAALIECPETLLQEVRETARKYGCDHYTSSFAEESFYSFLNAEKALSALIEEQQKESQEEQEPEEETPVSAPVADEKPIAKMPVSDELLQDVVKLNEEIDPYGFFEEMIPDIKEGLSEYPECTVEWIEEDFLKYRDDFSDEVIALAEKVRACLLPFTM